MPIKPSLRNDPLTAEEQQAAQVKSIVAAITGLTDKFHVELPEVKVNVPDNRDVIAEIRALKTAVELLAQKIPSPIKGFNVVYQNNRISGVKVER